jgi:hypothetical protein
MLEGWSKTSTVPVVWANFGIFSARSKWFPVGCDWWPWTKPGYITTTQRQSNNQWIGGIAAHPAPKEIQVQIPTGKDLASILRGDQDGNLHIDYLPRGQTINAEYYSSLLVQMKDILKQKRREISPRVSSSCTKIPRLTGHLQPRRNQPSRCSHFLITNPILRIWPNRTTICSLDWKNNLMVAIVLPTRRSLLPRRPSWTDKLLSFF